jgi:PAS domain S-box-containing protein
MSALSTLEQSLAAADSRWELFAEQMPAAGWTTDRALRLTSTYGVALSGIGEDQLGRTIEEILADERGPAVAAHDRSLDGGRGHYVHVVEGREFAVATGPLRQRSGEISGVVALARDVTVERQRERWTAGRHEVLELIASDRPLPEIFDRLARAYREAHPRSRPAVLMLEDERLLVVGPRSELLSENEYFDLETHGPCCAAALGREHVAAAWSESDGSSCAAAAIVVNGGRPLGVFACQYEQPNDISEREEYDRPAAAGLAALAVARSHDHRDLRRSEERADSLFDDAHDMISLVAPDGRLLSANRALARTLGYSSEALLGMTVAELLPRSSRVKAAILARRLAVGGAVGISQLELLTQSGDIVSVEVSMQIVSEEGVVVATQVFARDVTERQQAEEALRVSEERLALAVDATNDGVWDWEIVSKLCYYSPLWKAMLGYTPEELRDAPETFIDLLHPEDREGTLDAYEAFAAGSSRNGDPESFERHYRLRHRSGSYRWILSRGTGVEDAEGRRVRFVGAHRDVTDKRELADEVAAGELSRDVVSRLGVGIQVYELVDSADAASLALVEANACAARFPTVAGTDLVEAYRKVALGGDALDLDDLALEDGHPEGGVFSVRAFPLPNRRVGVTFTNVTAARALEGELRQAHKMEAVGRLAGGVAHDFNNLLTAMSGYTAFAQGRVAEHDDDLRSDLSQVQEACERARALTQQLLGFSRRQVLQPQAVDVNEIILDTARLLTRLIGEDIELVTELDPGSKTVRADRGQIEQVLMNLALNARDAMPRGGLLRLQTENANLSGGKLPGGRAVAPGFYVRIGVEDNGCGMDAQTLERIFEPFFTTKELGAGTGLGLATVQGVIEQSGGYVSVDSTPGQSTTFDLYLPMVTDEALPKPHPALDAVGGQERILLVEDDHSVRTLVERMLEAQGYAVTAFAAPAAALARAATHEFDLLLTDVVMPGMTGRELVDGIRECQPHIRVLYVSGYAEDVVLARGVSNDESGFLQKPFTLSELSAKLRLALDATAS